MITNSRRWWSIMASRIGEVIMYSNRM